MLLSLVSVLLLIYAPTYCAADAADSRLGGYFWNALVNAVPILLVGIILYFFLIIPERRKREAFMKLIHSIGVGDRILLDCGVYGSVVESRADRKYFKVEVAKGVVIKVLKTSITGLVKPGVSIASKDA